MRFISWLLTAAAMLGMSACRLDLKGENADDSTQSSAVEHIDDDNNSGGRTPVVVGESESDDDSSLTCATAAILGAAKEFKDGTTHLSGAYHVTGTARASGDVIIEPGTTLIFDADSSLEIGPYLSRTTLTALGTKAAPIRLCSDKPLVGRWRGLMLSAGLTSDSTLQHLHIYDAGAVDAALHVDGPVQLTDVYIHGSKSDGVIASQFGEGSSGLTVEHVQGSALVLTAQAALANLPQDVVFGDNVDNAAHIRFDQYRDGSVRLPNLGVPYVQDGDMQAFLVTIDIDPGVEYRFAADVGLDVGRGGDKALFRANGTAAAPIVFRGVSAKKAAWRGIEIDLGVSTDSILSHVQIVDGGGNAKAPLSVHAAITLSDVQVSNSALGPEIYALLAPGSANLSVSGCDGPAVYSQFAYLTGMPRGGKISGNGKDVVQLKVDNQSAAVGVASIPNLGVPYYVVDDIEVGEGADLTLEPGVELVFESGHPHIFRVGSNSKIVANGTAAAPIIFRSEKDEVGTWRGIDLDSQVSTDSLFNYVQVQNAGLTTRAPITITNCNFSKSADFGITKEPDNMTDYAATNTFVSNVMGDVGLH